MRVRTILAASIFCIAVHGLLGSAMAQEKPIERVEPVQFGEPFPAGTYSNLNSSSGPETIDFATVLGKKPIVLFYWIPGNPRADLMFADVQRVVSDAGEGKIALYAVALPREGRGVDVIREGIQKVGATIPVLNDVGFVIGQRLRVQSVPNISIIDGEGQLRLTNGASLAQVLEYKMNVQSAIERVASTGKLGTYGYLSRYYPVNELVGKDCPDFTASWITTKVEQRWSSLIDDEKVNVLIFWSVDCPHCRKSLPQISDWLKKNPDGLNVISAAKVTSEVALIKTREFCDTYGLVFPTLIDQDLDIASTFQVTSTPTVIIIGPDGVVDSVVLSGTSIPEALEKKRRELLATQG
jgi:thiol-disulfide isomerase/thioredoxin